MFFMFLDDVILHKITTAELMCYTTILSIYGSEGLSWIGYHHGIHCTVVNHVTELIRKYHAMRFMSPIEVGGVQFYGSHQHPKGMVICSLFVRVFEHHFQT